MRKRRKQDEAPEAEAPETPEDTQEPQQGSEDAGPAPEPTPEERVAELEGLLARSRADYANLRRRTRADQDAAVARAEGALLCELLTFADWLDMALITEVTSPDAVTIKEGVRLTRDQLSGLLSARGVEPIPTDGAFDPATHQAVATVEDEGAEPGSIAAVVRKGWRRGESVLRHAQVKVVAAPEPAASAGDDATGAAEEA